MGPVSAGQRELVPVCACCRRIPRAQARPCRNSPEHGSPGTIQVRGQCDQFLARARANNWPKRSQVNQGEYVVIPHGGPSGDSMSDQSYTRDPGASDSPHPSESVRIGGGVMVENPLVRQNGIAFWTHEVRPGGVSSRSERISPTLSANRQNEAHEVSFYQLDADAGFAAIGVATGGRMTMNPMSRIPLLDHADCIPVGVCKTA